LPFRFLADLGRDLLRGGGDGSLLLLRSRAQEVLGKIVQFGFEMLTQARRRTVYRRADLIVERHCLGQPIIRSVTLNTCNG
jgi:Ribonuclease G/E